MVSSKERDQLENAFRREPVSALGTLLTCAIGLMVVIAMALIGFEIHSYDSNEVPLQTVSQTR